MINIKECIACTILALSGLIAVFFKGKKAGREKEKNNQRKVIEKNVKKAKNARDNITDAKRNRMRKKRRR